MLEKGVSNHSHERVPMKAMPGSGFVVIETELIFGGFETVFDGPAMVFDRYLLFHGRFLGTPCGEESEITVGNVPADQ